MMDYVVCVYVYVVYVVWFFWNYFFLDYEWKLDMELRMDVLEKENIKLRNRIE